VHANTVSKTKDPESNLIQIVSRGNGFGGFITLHVEDESIEIKHLNEIGPKLKFNNDYVEDGVLRISKTDPANAAIESSGELLVLDDEVALIHVDFEEITPLGGPRQVHSLRDDENRIARWVVMGGVNCTEGLANQGSFGVQYDAQVASLVLRAPGRNGAGHAGEFSAATSFGIYGTGPPTHGEIVSVEMWIRTSATDGKMILASYFQYYRGLNKVKDHLLLTLENGVPTFYVRKREPHRADVVNALSDNAWHHVALTMPKKSCRPSEMYFYVDGQRANLTSSGGHDDNHIFFITQGRMSFGGFGYASEKAKGYYGNEMKNYVGLMDDAKVYSHTIQAFDP